MKTVSSIVEINASPKRVWAIFIDLPGHASWDPFITAISGPLPVWQGRVRHSSASVLTMTRARLDDYDGDLDCFRLPDPGAR